MLSRFRRPDKRCGRFQVAGRWFITHLFTKGRRWWVVPRSWYFHWSASVTTLEGHIGVNDRIAYAVFETHKMHRPLALGCAYDPTLPSCQQNSELRELFYDSLEQALDRFPRHAFVFVCGDWNSKVGRREPCSTFQCLGSGVGVHVMSTGKLYYNLLN